MKIQRLRFHLLFLGMIFLSFPTISGKETAEEQKKIINVETTITAVSAAELEISDKRVSKSVTWKLNFLSPMSLEQRKQNLIIELCREVGADVLVDPQFTFTKRMMGGGKLTVSGYPATYTNFRSMSDQEVDAFIASPEYETGKVVFINK